MCVVSILYKVIFHFILLSVSILLCMHLKTSFLVQLSTLISFRWTKRNTIKKWKKNCIFCFRCEKSCSSITTMLIYAQFIVCLKWTAPCYYKNSSNFVFWVFYAPFFALLCSIPMYGRYFIRQEDIIMSHVTACAPLSFLPMHQWEICEQKTGNFTIFVLWHAKEEKKKENTSLAWCNAL